MPLKICLLFFAFKHILFSSSFKGTLCDGNNNNIL